jgi:chloramphenicol-sensitive protein RarD
MNNLKHYLAAVAAFTIWGFFPWLLKSLSAYTAGEILYFRILFASLILVVIITIIRRKIFQRDIASLMGLPSAKRWLTITGLLAGGALLTVNWLIFIYTVNNINIRTASFSYLICPVLTAVMGYWILHEKLSPLQWFAVALCAASCAMIGVGSLSELAFAFSTALTYGLYLVLQRRSSEFDRISVLCVQIVFSFVILNAAYPYLLTTIPAESGFYLKIITIAALFTVLPLFLNLFALIRINSATVGILMYINPLINFAIAIFIFHEQISMLQFVGYAIILVGLIAFNYPYLARIRLALGSER